MVIKVDMEKVYDHLCWDFIRESPKNIKCLINFINLVWHCVTTGRIRMLRNGETLKEFYPSRGVRQGDPISPYLFIMCIERFFHLINLVVDKHFWKPIQLKCGGPLIPYLAFVNDLFLFMEASKEYA